MSKTFLYRPTTAFKTKAVETPVVTKVVTPEKVVTPKRAVVTPVVTEPAKPRTADRHKDSRADYMREYRKKPKPG